MATTYSYVKTDGSIGTTSDQNNAPGIAPHSGFSVGSINSSTLAPQTPIKLPTPPTTNYDPALANGYATIAANGPSIAPPPPTATTPSNDGTDLTALFDKYMGANVAPPSATDIYSGLYKTSGIDAAQNDLVAKQKATKDATSALTALQNQLAGITAEGQAMNLRQDNRLAPMSAIVGTQAQNNRETAIRALALQPQVLAAQAKIASAQGDEQLAQGILQQAQQHLDTVYQLQVQDAQTQYNYQKDLRDKVYEFATAQEKAKLDAQQREDDKAFELQKMKIQNDYQTQQTKLQASLSNAGSGIDTTPSTTSQAYTLQAGDDPYNIAQANGIDMTALQKLNPSIQDWHNLPVGTQINLPLPAGTLSTNPTVDSYAQGILSGSITSIAQVPKQYKDAVQTALSQPGQNGYSPLASSRFTMAANRIVSNYIALPQYELTANGLPYLQRIDAAIKNPGSVSDQDLLDSLTKLNTAGNAVTDAQVRVITDGKSFADMASTFQNKFANGGVLSQNQRNQIQEIAKAIYTNYKTGYQPVYDQATSQLKASGIPKAFWTIPDLNNLSAGVGETPDASSVFDSLFAQYGGK